MMPKTTIKVRAKRWELFNLECKAASMRRDDFLNRTLPKEIELFQEIAPCDEEGERWLKRRWIDYESNWGTELRPVAVLLSGSVIEQLNFACAQKMVPRDAFVDCALSFFTARLREAVIVIKDPRTHNDLVGKIAVVLNDDREELTESDEKLFIVETVREWHEKRNLEPLSDDFYQRHLSWDAGRVAKERTMLEAFDLIGSVDPVARTK